MNGADARSSVEAVEPDGVERDVLIRTGPLVTAETGEIKKRLPITLFGITRLAAADLITFGELPWA